MGELVACLIFAAIGYGIGWTLRGLFAEMGDDDGK